MRSSVRGITLCRWVVAGVIVLATGTAFAAEPYRVGPGGTHATLQSALDDAVRGGVNRDIHVAAGRWRERIRLELFDDIPSRIRVFGGWNAAFTERTEDPAATVLDGGGGGSVFQIDADTVGHLYIKGFTFTGGDTAESGGGLQAYLRGHFQLTLEGNRIVGNRAGGDRATGGGLSVILWEDTRLWMRDNRVEGNVAESPGAANGGGAHVSVIDSAYAQIVGNHFVGNEARSATNGTFHAGIGVFASGDGAADFERNHVQGNRSVAKFPGSALTLAASRPVAGPNASWIAAVRNEVLENVGGSQVWVRAQEGGRVRLADSIVARGTGRGLNAEVAKGGTAHLTNLTVARNSGEALRASGDGVAHLSNTILFENGGEVGGTVTESHNFRGDPLFVDPASDYHLRSGSPAIDAGDGAPPGDRSLLDIDGDSRRRGDGVDIGADEAAPAPGDEPVCSIFPYVWARTPICRCLSEPTLLHARCGAIVDDVFMSVRIPLDIEAGELIKAEWTILPWLPLSTPYKMTAEAFLDGEWVPQKWFGPSAPVLKDGLTVREGFTWTLSGKLPTPVRTTLEYLRPGFEEPTRVGFEVTMPKPVE